MCQTADLRGGTPFPRMDLVPFVPVGYRVALFGRLVRRGRCFGLEGARPGAPSGYASLGGPVGGHSIDWTCNQVLQVAYPPGLFLVVSGVLTS